MLEGAFVLGKLQDLQRTNILLIISCTIGECKDQRLKQVGIKIS